MQPGIFFLEDGTCWEGELFGACQETFGEAVFNTAFTGYEEILTDPSYKGQIVVMAFPHIGNYGITLEDKESSECHVRGFVVKEKSSYFSHRRGKRTLEDFLKESGVTGISGVDTRAVVKHLRNRGALRSILSPETNLDILLRKVQSSHGMAGSSFLDEVSTREVCHYENTGPRIILYDFGLKHSILKSLLHQKFEVFVVPGETPAQKALSLNPKGFVFSNGPGDPAVLFDQIETVKKLLKTEFPAFGICLGHQLLGLAFGGKTYKLKFGHRGVNHPVKNLQTGEVSITSHNHGFAVDMKTLPISLIPAYQSLYDGVLEGFCHRDFPCAAVQFHPEAAPGPHDENRFFQKFIEFFPEI
ncbi:MAG: glutamine-hydrolyzing carbamoyl-phosphate synthase small subunit [Firmicutes bacterium]|nr:glutamine-hydrolyzing carbamoyl-phosphate synthase small subunit [Bacillota bacterium]